jgi:AraC-like DNA-binding protein
MTDIQVYPKMLAVLLPAFIAGACMILTLFSRRDSITPQERTLKNAATLYLAMIFLSWVCVFAYLYFPKAFVFLNILSLAGCIMAPVFFFRIIRLLTRMEMKENFSPLHYLVPSLIGAVFLGWSLFVPYDVQVAIVESRQTSIAGEYAAYSRLFCSKPLLRMIFLFVYYAFIARLLVRYYRAESRRTDAARLKPDRWVKFLIALSLISVFSSARVLFSSRSNEDALSAATIVASICVSGQFILLTYHIIRRKYLLYAAQTKAEEKAEADGRVGGVELKEQDAPNDARRLRSDNLSRRSLNAWFRNEKPYLKTDFKITDLAEAMDVNRTAASDFINRAYGVNFNRLVNQWRLHELKRLQSMPSGKGKGKGKSVTAELAARAGFANLRHYYRAKAIENELQVTQ